MTDAHVLVVGAGPAGLAAGATLKAKGIEPMILDAAESVGDSWRAHYDRLHLHTVRWLSGLPGMPISKREGKWVPRDGVVRYLEAYAKHHGLSISHSTEVKRIDRSGDSWAAYTDEGPISADHVVVATGYNRRPRIPNWPGRDSFLGELVHSSEYRNPEPYVGKTVLVVGTGNSGAEIAVDLVESGGREVAISVRTPPNIMRRDIGGFPSQVTGILMRHLPPRVVDTMARGMRRLSIGDLRPYGLPAPRRGLYTRLTEDDVVPILDVGLVDLVKGRKVQVVPAVMALEGNQVLLAGGERVSPDAVIAATGFDRALEEVVGHLGVLGKHGRPVVRGAAIHPNAPNMYFIGFANPISGYLRELGIEAKRIARAIQASRRRELKRAG
ncbi:MAG: flavin-containing monooxygenase [Actinomycetota bacterium]